MIFGQISELCDAVIVHIDLIIGLLNISINYWCSPHEVMHVVLAMPVYL